MKVFYANDKKEFEKGVELVIEVKVVKVERGYGSQIISSRNSRRVAVVIIELVDLVVRQKKTVVRMTT